MRQVRNPLIPMLGGVAGPSTGVLGATPVPSRHYAAFLSYSHADARWAGWLQKKLESFRVPRRLVGTDGEYGAVPARIAPVFRDREELASASDLGGHIRAALDASDALVVICSPAAEHSRWVNEEIRTFRRRGLSHRIHCLVVDGENLPGHAPRFPPALTEPLDGQEPPEPIAADLREGADGKALAVQKLIAGLLGVGLDDLRRREAQHRHKRMVWIAAAALAGMSLAVVLASLAVVARDDAQRRQAQAEDLLGFMVDDLRPKLQELGRLDLLDAVGDKAMAYFDSLPARDLSDTALSQQARALTQIGQVRFDQGRHDAAQAAFAAARARALELHRRSPADGARLFDLAQSEFWIGSVAWRQGDLETTERWFRSYLERSEALVAMDPSRFDWQREVAYGYHNLAVLDEGRGRHAQAARAFERELALYRGWLLAHPDDSLLQFEAANVASWLGSATEYLGHLVEAETYFREADDINARNQAREPDVMSWKDNRIDTAILLAKVRIRLGRMAAARDGLIGAVAFAETLVAHDPGNHGWRRSQGSTQLSLAMLHLACGDVDAAADRTARALPVLAKVYAEEPKDGLALSYFLRASLVDADIALARKDAASAAASIAATGEPLEAGWTAEPSESLRQLSALRDLLEAEVLVLQGKPGPARERQLAAVRTLEGDAGGELPFGRLELMARAQRALGDAGLADQALQRLAKAGGVMSPSPQQCRNESAGSPASTRTGP